MSQFKVFQAKISEKVYDYVNQVGHTKAAEVYPEYKISLNVKFRGGSRAWESWMFEHYGLVCEIEAEDLNGVFHIGNMGPEEKITRIAPMHSISVGDIIEDENGVFHMVDSVGFSQVEVA